MKSISRTEIETAWDALCDLDEKQSVELLQTFSQEQPFLMVYAAAQDEVLNEQGDNESMISLVMMIWKLLRQTPSKEVTDRAIEKAKAENVRFLEQVDEGSQMQEQDAMVRLLKNHNQAEILGFCVEVLMSGYEEAPDLAPEEIGMQLLTLKTIIDCLDR